MESLFNQTTEQHIIQRLQKLQAGIQPHWGKMNAAQMMAHCQASFQTYFGETKIKRGLISFLFGSIAKKKLFSDKPWPRGLPTAKEYIIADERVFENERNKLVELIQRFCASGKTDQPPKHPFFGTMTTDEWSAFAYKHLDHHLQQFGV